MALWKLKKLNRVKIKLLLLHKIVHILLIISLNFVEYYIKSGILCIYIYVYIPTKYLLILLSFKFNKIFNIYQCLVFANNV